MSDWKRVIAEIVESMAIAAREAKAKQQSQRSATLHKSLTRAKTRGSTYQSNRCLFWDCQTPVRADHVFCYDHYQDLQYSLIDECTGCGRAKDIQYDFCLDCYRNQRSQSAKNTSINKSSSYQWYRPEYSQAWEKQDASASRFFVYILKLDGGQFYAGQTRELKERLSEHKDGKTKSTAGKNPKLVWFSVVESREEATNVEVELKKLIDTNPREIRRMMIRFRDLVRELEYNS